jgi:transcription initiation factor TFIIH subunit 3
LLSETSINSESDVLAQAAELRSLPRVSSSSFWALVLRAASALEFAAHGAPRAPQEWQKVRAARTPLITRCHALLPPPPPPHPPPARPPPADADFLTILLETGPAFWARLAAAGGPDPRVLLEQLLAFARAFALLDDANQFALFAVGGAGSSLLYATPGCAPYAGGGGSGTPEASEDVAEAVLGRLRVALAADAARGGGSGGAGAFESALSAGLSRALCFINKFQRAGAGAAGGGSASASNTASAAAPGARARARPRVLVLAACPDAPAQYVGAMNAIFAAQRAGVAVDAAALGPADSPFLQQAAHLTGGAYLRPARPEALLQYLLAAAAAGGAARRLLRPPRAAAVDFRAACFCHRRPTDLGYVCSVCLSIYCGTAPACATCGAEFADAAAAPSGGGGAAAAPG